ncbi:MAG: hypothetical protein HYZ71_08245 [Deltaproteobacteria bacterium]|nr:hypothetical protein [Deltaproteobacteria bacterium]
MRSALTVVALSLSAQMACALPEFIPLQERAQGHSLVGAAQFNESVYSNPAAAAFTPVYSVEGSMMQGTLAASIVDTKTSYIGGTIGYVREDDPVTGPMQSIRLGVSRKINDVLAFGVMGKTIWTNTARLNDADVGILARLSPVELGFVTRNITGGNLDVANQQREVAYGGRIGFKDSFFISASATALAGQALSPYEYGLGTEFISPYYFSVKGGYRVETVSHLTHWSAGASFISPRISAHYAVEFADNSGTIAAHQVGLSLLF